MSTEDGSGRRIGFSMSLQKNNANSVMKTKQLASQRRKAQTNHNSVSLLLQNTPIIEEKQKETLNDETTTDTPCNTAVISQIVNTTVVNQIQNTTTTSPPITTLNNIPPDFYSLTNEGVEEQHRYDPNYPTDYEKIVQQREWGKQNLEDTSSLTPSNNLNITEVIPLKWNTKVRTGEEAHEQRKRITAMTQQSRQQNTLNYLVCNLKQLVSNEQTSSLCLLNTGDPNEIDQELVYEVIEECQNSYGDVDTFGVVILKLEEKVDFVPPIDSVRFFLRFQKKESCIRAVEHLNTRSFGSHQLVAVFISDTLFFTPCIVFVKPTQASFTMTVL